MFQNDEQFHQMTLDKKRILMEDEWEKWRKKMFEQRDIDETYKSLTDPF
jgi:ferredoxin-fold anticodon binding domain-containing protein